MIVNAGYRGKIGAASKFTYTGQYNIRKDGVVELLTSGTIVFLEPKVIDVFMVGGGGSGSGSATKSETASSYKIGGGGGGGYTRTLKRMNVQGSYQIVIGAGGTSGVNGGPSAFGDVSVNGGDSGQSLTPTSPATLDGENGGSGGGAGVLSNSDYGAGGYDGSNGENGYPTSRTGGTGQNFTTREFGESTGKLYAGGGGGGRAMLSATPIISAGGTGGGGSGGFAWAANNVAQAPAAGVANTGGGGGGGVASYYDNLVTIAGKGASGGSGIVCFREAQELPELAGTWVLNERLYAPEKNFDEINLYFTIGNSRCSRIKTTNLTYLSAYKVIFGDEIAIYQFSNTWKTTTRSLTFETGATASDEFRAWLASNATKQ